MTGTAGGISGCLFLPFWWTQYHRNTVREFLEIWHKCPLRPEDELIRISGIKESTYRPHACWNVSCFCEQRSQSHGNLHFRRLEDKWFSSCRHIELNSISYFVYVYIVKMFALCRKNKIKYRETHHWLQELLKDYYGDINKHRFCIVPW